MMEIMSFSRGQERQVVTRVCHKCRDDGNPNPNPNNQNMRTEQERTYKINYFKFVPISAIKFQTCNGGDNVGDYLFNGMTVEGSNGHRGGPCMVLLVNPFVNRRVMK